MSRVPHDQVDNLAKITAATPDTAPSRTGGFMAPRETGRQIRAQAGRPPTPGALQHPPPPGT